MKPRMLVCWTATYRIAALGSSVLELWVPGPGVRTFQAGRLVLRLAFEVWSRRFDSGSFIELTVITSPRMDAIGSVKYRIYHLVGEECSRLKVAGPPRYWIDDLQRDQVTSRM